MSPPLREELAKLLHFLSTIGAWDVSGNLFNLCLLKLCHEAINLDLRFSLLSLKELPRVISPYSFLFEMIHFSGLQLNAISEVMDPLLFGSQLFLQLLNLRFGSPLCSLLSSLTKFLK